MRQYTIEEIDNLVQMLESDDISSIALACEIIENNKEKISFGNEKWRIYWACSDSKKTISNSWFSRRSFVNGYQEEIYQKLTKIERSIVPMI